MSARASEEGSDCVSNRRSPAGILSASGGEVCPKPREHDNFGQTEFVIRRRLKERSPKLSPGEIRAIKWKAGIRLRRPDVAAVKCRCGQPVVAFEIDTGRIVRFPTGRAAAAFCVAEGLLRGLASSTAMISEAVRGRRKSACGYEWGCDWTAVAERVARRQPVIARILGTQEERHYESEVETVLAYQVSRRQIAKDGPQDGIIPGDEKADQEAVENRPVAGGDCPQGGGRKL